MTLITRASVRWPWRVTGLWLAGVIALSIIGLPLSKKLNPPQLGQSGSVAVANELGHGNFGEDSDVLLFGPRAVVASQGPGIVAALERATGAPMISPFSSVGPASTALWPPGRPAAVILSLANGRSLVPASVLTRFYRVVRSIVHPPVRAVISGPAPLRQDQTDESLQAASAASLLAFPALLLVLLLVFRSFVAAVVPLAVAGATVVAGKGILVLLAKAINIDATSDVQMSMIGLALGVDYSLLIVTRYREAVASGDSPGHAVHLAAHTAGKTASFAGLILAGILGITLELAPPGALASAAAGAIVATAASVFSALVVVPALLTLLGRWISPLPRQRHGMLGKVVDDVLHRPWLGLLAAVPLIVVAFAATAITTVPPTPLVLPSDSAGGRALMADGAAGIGVGFNVLMSRPNGPLTAPDVLRDERLLERQIQQLVAVRAVIGPGAITRLAGDDRVSGASTLTTARSAIPHLDAGLRAVSGSLASGDLALAAAIARLGANDVARSLRAQLSTALAWVASAALQVDGLSRTEASAVPRRVGGAVTPMPDGSGFTALAQASAAGPVRLAATRYVLNVAAGGGIGRAAVMTSLSFEDPRTEALVARIDRLTAAFAARTGVRAAVGGQAAQLLEFSDQTTSRLPLIIFGVAFVTFLALVAVLRSVLLAGIAVGLNLLSVVTMFGVLSLLYSGSHPLLGRTGGVDVISIVSIFTITFALSIDYQVFLLARMREGYLESQDATTAIRFGVERTARIVTGAALIMLATFAAFATTQIANIQQIGVGLATAIAVDATVVRLVILPAVLRLGGARTWWLPDWLERKLPELDVEGFAYIRARTGQATRAADVS